MTLADARKVAAILEEAHDRCKYCAQNLVGAAIEEFPLFTWSYQRSGHILVEKAERKRRLR